MYIYYIYIYIVYLYNYIYRIFDNTPISREMCKRNHNTVRIVELFSQ